MSSSQKSSNNSPPFITIRKSSKEDGDGAKKKMEPHIEEEPAKELEEDPDDEALATPKAGSTESEGEDKQSPSSQSGDASTRPTQIAKAHVPPKPIVKFTISLESNPEEEDADEEITSEASSFPLYQGRARQVDKPKESSSLPSLRLFLPATNPVSSPEGGSSPEIRHPIGRMRIHSAEASSGPPGSPLASTPTTSRRRQTFCGVSYLARRNLSRENAFEDAEDGMSVSSSSEFSPAGSQLSLGPDSSRLSSLHTGEDLSSDEAVSSDGKSPGPRDRATSELSDDSPSPHSAMAGFRSPALLSHSQDYSLLVTPVNKQLRIVTSVDRALHPHRRSSLSSPKGDRERSFSFGRMSTENLEHIAFVDYLKRKKLGQYLKNFPPNMSLLDFRLTTEEELSSVYGVHDADGRRALVRAIEAAREEDESDNDSMLFVSFCILFSFDRSVGVCLPPPSPPCKTLLVQLSIFGHLLCPIFVVTMGFMCHHLLPNCRLVTV
ncbi:microtubule-associated serine/threonine-protein kinase 2 [Elysia marginata]|uniref:Microtubule-associated serine/threonine-protein kinase 2 n=1 Tax=Elysia marginata TaxID=1093978 RepID=A0AAV4EUL4_9GAST|nr:microtubule-associated serine/threonine-protein kinase 2 [Elysia marginata]